jgi:hypothetical protein
MSRQQIWNYSGVSMSVLFFCVAMLRGFVRRYRIFGETYCCHLQGCIDTFRGGFSREVVTSQVFRRFLPTEYGNIYLVACLSSYLRFQVLTVASMKMAGFLGCCAVLSGGRLPTFQRYLLMEAAGTSETSWNFCWTPRRRTQRTAIFSLYIGYLTVVYDLYVI